MAATTAPTLRNLIFVFLGDLANAERSPHTVAAYRGDLMGLVGFLGDTAILADLTVPQLRAFLTTKSYLKAASRARLQAAIASFCQWAEQQEYLATNPMHKITRAKVEAPAPRSRPRCEIEAILKVIPHSQRRDRLFFSLMFELGLRVSEVLRIYLEDIDLTRDNERLSVVGKGKRPRTLLIDDPRLIKQLRDYLTHTGYQHGLLFRALKGGDGGPLRYAALHKRWLRYCGEAEITCTLHQLRHSHATELVNGGVSLATIRKRLGHQNIQTTLRYADQADATSDAELRAWRRTQHRN